MSKRDRLPDVQDQYENYPYPARNPQDEIKLIQMVYLDCLDRINHYCHSGRKDFSKGARVLIAGGGTGDSTIFLAEQLRDTDSDVIYLDFSKACMEVAQQRAKVRGLKNITWINDSLLNIPNLDLGKFDHISCTGVLHHLEAPDEGLRALTSVLGEHGALNIMVYGYYGRAVIYQIQTLMRFINKDETDMHTKIHNCRMALNAFPDNHLFHITNLQGELESDIELYDRFLHSQDRAYTIPQLYDFVEGSNLRILHFSPLHRGRGDAHYDPGMYIKDADLLKQVQKLELKEQHAIAELLNGWMTKHTFYATRDARKAPDPDNLDFIPSLPIQAGRGSYEALHQLVKAAGDDVILNIPSQGINLTFRKTPNVEGFFQLLDGKHTLGSIYDGILSAKGSEAGLTRRSLGQEFQEMFSVMFSHDLLFLRHESVTPYKTLEDLQTQIK